MTRRRDPHRAAVVAPAQEAAAVAGLPAIESPEALELITAATLDYLQDPVLSRGSAWGHPRWAAVAEGYGLAAGLDASARAGIAGPVDEVFQHAHQRARRAHFRARRAGRAA